MVVVVTKSKNLKTVTSLVRNGGQESFFSKRKIIICLDTYLSFYLHSNTVFRGAVIMISVLLVRKQSEGGHNLFTITQQINDEIGIRMEAFGAH